MMNSEIQIFESKQFGQLRTMVAENGEPWFMGKDVATLLGYKDKQKAIKMHVDEEDKLTRQIVVSGQGRNITIINESGLYSLILSSKLPNAKAFKRWVTSEVLPQIRKTGGYIPMKEKDGKEKIETSYENECDFNGLQKHLLFILMFGRKYPNSGQIRSQLNDFDARVTKLLNERTSEKGVFLWDDVDLDEDYTANKKTESNANQKKNNVFSGLKSYKKTPIWESIRPMVAIATQIALENITAAHYALRVASRLIDTLDDSDPEKMDIIRKVCDRLCNQHNTPYLEVWLQNITYTTDKVKHESRYTQELCKLVMGENVSLWNLTWLSPTLYEKFPYDQICNEKSLKDVTPVIKIKQKWQYNM